MADASNALPISDTAYRKLLVLALVLGDGGGLTAVVYSLSTAFGTGFLFGDLPVRAINTFRETRGSI